MLAEFEWSGYALQAQSGMSEALQAAGVDCTVPKHYELDFDVDSAHDGRA